MPNIPRIKIGSTTYNIKDEVARGEQDNVVKAIKYVLTADDCIVWANINENKRLQVSNGGMTAATNQFVTDYIPIREGMQYKLNATLNSGTYGNVFYRYDKSVLSTVSGSGGYYQKCVAPEGAAWVRFTIQNTYLTNHSATITLSCPEFDELVRTQGDIVERTKWLAIGDSITYGVYSFINGNSSDSGVTIDCWVRLLANALGYDLTVMASRGMGYTVTGMDPLDPDGPRIPLSTLLTRIEALTDDYNLITLALGINDYNTDSSSISDIIASFDTAVQRILTKFPSARLVVITPFNECRQGDTTTNYAYNSSYGGRSLKDIADAIKTRCQSYGIECFYATNGFIFNNYNIVGLQPDTVHPSLIGHKLIAKGMAHTLLN